MLRHIDVKAMLPFESGYMHGEAAMASVLANISTTYSRLQRLGLEKVEARRTAYDWVERCKVQYREYIDEVDGIAAGAECDREDLYVLNFRLEIGQPLQAAAFAKSLRTVVLGGLTPACTMFATGNQYDDSVPRFAGQTLDGLAAVGGNLVTIRREIAGGSRTISVHEAGVAGPCLGMSSCNFSMTYAGVILESCSTPKPTLPLRARYRLSLEASNLNEAIYIATQEQTPCSVAAMLAGRDGRIAMMETLDGEIEVLYASKPVVTHSNHLIRGQRDRSLFQYHLPDSLFRATRLARLIEGVKISTESLKLVLSDHYSYPAAICLHPDPAVPSERQAATLCAVIFDLKNGVFHISDGQPCLGQWLDYRL